MLSPGRNCFSDILEIDVLSHLSTMFNFFWEVLANTLLVRKTPTWKCSGIGMNMFARNAAVGSIA